MFFKKLSDEARFTFYTVIAVLMVPVAFYLVNLFTESNSPPPTPHEMKVIVTEAEKKRILAKLPPQTVLNSVREAIKQGNHSTVYMQVGKAPQNTAESEELRKMLAQEVKKAQRPGIKKVADNPQNPVKYYDETSPRDRSVDAFYIYLVDLYGNLWPRLCIQSASKKPINITSYSINADGKTFALQPVTIKIERLQDKSSEYYDALLDNRSYNLLQAVLKSRKAVLTSIGTKGKLEREISEKERQGLTRIMEAYAALGGKYEFAQPAAPLPSPATPHRKGAH